MRPTKSLPKRLSRRMWLTSAWRLATKKPSGERCTGSHVAQAVIVGIGVGNDLRRHRIEQRLCRRSLQRVVQGAPRMSRNLDGPIRIACGEIDAQPKQNQTGEPRQHSQGESHEVRHLLRASAAAAVGRGRRAQAVPGGARPGGAGRQARHRLRLGGRASLPRGVLALLGAGGVPRRLLAAHQAHPPRPRHRADAAQLQPPGARGRAHRHARSRLQRPRRMGHRPGRVRRRARRLPHRPRRAPRHVAGGHHARPPTCW